jgi:hypothetical protein
MVTTMLEKKTRNCPYNDEIVSYIYGELGEGAASGFETHLADCTVCTDEFAAVSNARFSVYEWQKEEFAPLPTPQFSIPYATAPVSNQAPGIFAGLRDLFAFGRWPALAAAGAVLALGVGFIAMNFSGSDDQPIAVNAPQIERPTEPAVPQIANGTTDAPAPEIEKPEIAVAAEKRPVKTTQVRYTRKANVQEPVKKATTARKPALTDFDDNADTSLRLADLFDGIGS